MMFSPKHRLIPGLLLALATSATAQQAYTWTDSAGVVHFSDKAPGNQKSETVELTPAHSLSSSASERSGAASPGEPVPATPGGSATATAPQQETRYSTLAISSPADDVPVRANNGEVQLSCQSSPALDRSSGHSYRFVLDGQPLSQTSSACSVVFRQVERGTHSAYVEIINEQQQTLIRSQTHRFHVQRFSAL